ncbi:hypothetical protein [Candidatus Burkholderia verschuerenii]|uniref:hypothetical protein n=1 Tax=Candidatus Burkholderia verschuerenii TaxID=242163 RepID=UPI00067C926A
MKNRFTPSWPKLFNGYSIAAISALPVGNEWKWYPITAMMASPRMKSSSIDRFGCPWIRVAPNRLMAFPLYEGLMVVDDSRPGFARWLLETAHMRASRILVYLSPVA